MVGIVLVVLGAVQLVLGVGFIFDDSNDLGLGLAGRVAVGIAYGGILGLGAAAVGVFLIARRGVFARRSPPPG